jgi:type I restriction enzyme S subunit
MSETPPRQGWKIGVLRNFCSGECGAIQTGPFGSQLHASDYRDAGVPVVNPTHLLVNGIDESNVPHIDKELADTLSRHYLREGDILISRRGDFSRYAYIKARHEGWLCGTGCLLVRVCHPDVDNRFVAASFSLETIQTYLKQSAVGSIMPNLNTRILGDVPLFLPSRKEQDAIVKTLDAIREARAVRSVELRLECERKAALMGHLFTHGIGSEATKQSEIGEIPESWRIVEIESIAKVGNGSTPSRADERYWNYGTIPWITSTKVHDVVIRESDEFVTETARSECHLPLVPQHSLVVAITGQGKTLGNAAILEFDTCINQHLAYIHITDESVHPYYALFYLRSKYQYFRGVSSGGGSTKGALTCGFLNRMKIPVPSKDEQERIAALLSACEKKSVCLEKEIGNLDELFAAALDELMNGRLDASVLVDGGSNE